MSTTDALLRSRSSAKISVAKIERRISYNCLLHARLQCQLLYIVLQSRTPEKTRGPLLVKIL